MDSEIRCPVCFEIPENAIYQCEDGHTLCSTCYSSVTKCPQCRIPFGKKKIRCRPMESMLDTMTFPCHHEDFGCNVKLKRFEMKKHLGECRFGFKSVRLCELLGFKCDFETSDLALSTALEHFESSHGFVSILSRSFQVTLENFEGVTSDSSNEPIIWTPVIIKLKERGATYLKFLLIPRINEDDKSFSADAILLGEGNEIDGKDFKVDFEMKHTSSNSNEVEDIIWSRTVISLRHAPTFLNLPILRFPSKFLREYFMSKGTLKINVGIRRTTSMDDKLQHLNVANNLHIFPVRVAMWNQNELVFSSVSCDVCGADPVNVLYKCLQCPDYDLCQTCMTKKMHSEHIFALIKSDQHYEFISKVGKITQGNGYKPILPSEPNKK